MEEAVEPGELSLVVQVWGLLLAFYRAKIVTVEVAAILFILGKSLYTPLCEQYFYHRYGAELLKNTSFEFPNGSFCVSSELINNYTGNNNTYKLDETFSNHLLVYTQIASTIAITIFFGPLTDRYGRKIGIIIPAVGMVLQSIFSVVIVVYSLHPYYFIIANFVGGIFGNFTCMLAASFSYIADVSSTRWRSFRVGVIEGGLALGSCFGHLLGGYWLDRVNCNYEYPLLFVMACFILIVLYISILVPESMTKEERKAMHLNNPDLRGVRAYFEGFKLFCGGLSLSSTWRLYVTTIVANVSIVNMFGADFVNVYFLKALPFDFNPFVIGLYQALRSFSQGFSNFFLTGILVALRVGDAWIMMIGTLFNIVTNILTGFSRKGWQLFAIASVKGIEGIVWSGARGLISKLVRPNQQGAIFSIIASVESLASLLAGVIWPLVFPVTLQHNMMSGITYIFMAALASLGLPLLVSLLLMKKADFERGAHSEGGPSPNSSDSSEEDYRPLLTDSWNSNKAYHTVNT